MPLIFKVRDDGAKAKLDALLSGGKAKSAFEAVGSVITNRVRLCFRLGTDPYGQPWKKIKWRAPRTDKRYKKRTVYTQAGKSQKAANDAFAASKGQPLRDTGRLQRSITFRADGAGVTIGTNVKYARIHQFGGDIVPKRARRLVFPGPSGKLIFAKKVTIPKRSFLPVRRFGADPELPPAWSVAVVRAIKARLLGKKG